MGAFLFYLFKATLCLTVFYLLFRLCFRSDTLFRTNRLLLLGGTWVCMVLPGVQGTVSQDTPWQRPMVWVETWLTEERQAETFQTESRPNPSASVPMLPSVKEDRPADPIRWVFTLYGVGAGIALLFFLLSLWRMRSLLRHCPVRKYGRYRLVIGWQKEVSFSWGRTIVLSQDDYAHHREAVLLHELMHLRYLHTGDLVWMEALVVLHWFNPAVWLLMRDLREVHEFEADRGVLLHGIDATQYQLLLVKKSVGTRLYSMASGIGHSKLKKRINMMLKKRTSKWARLKLLLFVPVAAGTLYAFARPEVKRTADSLMKPQVSEPVKAATSPDERELLEQYFARKYQEGGGDALPYNDRTTYELFVNYQNQVMLDEEMGPKADDLPLRADFVEHALSDRLRQDYQKAQQAGEPFRKRLQLRYDRGSTTEAMRLYLQTVKEVYAELRREVGRELGTTDEAILDKVFPILVNCIMPQKFYKAKTDSLAPMPVEVTFLTSSGQKKVLKDISLKELRKEAETFMEGKQEVTVSLRVDTGTPMGAVIDVKAVLREVYALRSTL